MDQTQSDSNFIPASSSAASLMEYIYLLWQWAWVIVLVGILAGTAAYFISKGTTPVYETGTRLFVNAPSSPGKADGTLFVNNYYVTTTYAKMLTDYPVLKGVVDRLKLNIDPASLVDSIKVAEIPNTQLINVTVTGTDPKLIIEVANSLGTVFSEQINLLQSQRYTASKDALKVQVDDMGNQVAAASAELVKTTDPALKQEVETRLAQYRSLYAGLLTSYEQVRLAEAQTSINVTVSDPAREALKIAPKTLQNTILAILAAMLAVAGGVFGLDFLDDTIRNPEEVRSKFGLPILGMIARHTSPEGRPITQDQPRSPVAESFRSLRTNVKFSSVDVRLRRILVTSATPQDGKTTISGNLAIAFAQSDMQVVLIDADLRRPQQHHRFGLSNKVGLSDLMMRPLEDIPEVIQPTTVPGLKIIACGSIPPNPAELLGSKKMIQILDYLGEENDLVIVDTPPVMSVTDAAAIASGMDGVILVAKPGSTKLAAFQQSVEQLQAVGAHILGVALNEIEPRSRRYGYYYHRYYSKDSYYYTTDGVKKKKKMVKAEAEA